MMHKMISTALAVCVALGSLGAGATAQQLDDGLLVESSEALAGKRVGFVPIAMGFDLTEAWASGLRLDAEKYGYELLIRDPNWSVDAGAQAFSQLIAEQPDVIVVHPPEIQAYTRLIQQANAQGIPVVTMNLKADANGDVFIGANWWEIAERQTRVIAEACSPAAGKSGKIAVMQGVLTNPTSQFGIQAIEQTLEDYPDIEIVSNQAADWDASKAHAIAGTVLTANPDLCGFIGMWDNMDVGIAAAIRESGRADDVLLVSSGGGNEASACENVRNGSFSTYVSYDARGQARDLMMTVRGLLQHPPEEAGAQTTALYTPLKTIDEETLNSGSCWNLDDVRAYGP